MSDEFKICDLRGLYDFAKKGAKNPTEVETVRHLAKIVRDEVRKGRQNMVFKVPTPEEGQEIGAMVGGEVVGIAAPIALETFVDAPVTVEFARAGILSQEPSLMELQKPSTWMSAVLTAMGVLATFWADMDPNLRRSMITAGYGAGMTKLALVGSRSAQSMGLEIKFASQGAQGTEGQTQSNQSQSTASVPVTICG